jgi:hypothetical protein
MADNLTVTPGPPALRLVSSGAAGLVFAWPVATPGFTLQEIGSLGGGVWSNLTSVPVVVVDENQVTLLPESSPRFYRLIRP